MASFIQIDQPLQHTGILRAQVAAASIKDAAQSFDGARGAATLLLAASVSALLVAANHVIDTWTDGHLLLAWIALWCVAFAALALLAAPMRRAGVSLRNGWQAWQDGRKAFQEDQKLWNIAMTYARIMAELSHVMSRVGGRDTRSYS